ncbi:hypothetical protein VOLCADRAFT_97515 [Volvox carteri f. nagariensis]|uniref:Uncharacterized protein n=1 Tax=Volvox carteri f. nagariensis TaxID=3068 RepID=D8UCX9_VOLCA|nr:uncharacterized protein VOLCADRAFT_97515 [Volvox carteri f. nagariensis]EFJ42420.1 hypothetical protein VOLCADRAFT_97515 [Volvox carteri f. nagariensis]|eukprot:XP_002956483.1 hypothetical protein VOLCADRAFT_97515 [Volvox carteri f. nagariensis]
MSQSEATPTGSPWLLQSRVEVPSPEDHQRDILNRAYQKALAALASAQAVVAGIAYSLYDVDAGQTDVSARLSGRPAMRYTGRKRKLSPSVYDYSDSCFGGAAGKADTPTHDLLPASRSELRSHQLLAVRWLVSLELQGAGGVLADELEQDRRAEVAGLLSHLLAQAPLTSLLSSSSSSMPMFQEMLQGFAGGSGSGGAGIGPGGGGEGGGGNNTQICLLLAPGGSLGGWAEAIREHVDVSVQLYDGTAGCAAALQTACAEPGSASGSGCRPGLNFGIGLNRLEGCGRRRQGMDLESYPHLHLLTRLPAACRVLLSAGVPEPSGDGIWLLLQLLAPKVHRPLWEAVCELQQGLLASGAVGAHSKEAVLSEIHSRLWGLLRPLTLHRRARDVELTTMRAVATNLNLYDHFSAADGGRRADGGATSSRHFYIVYARDLEGT